MRKIEMSQGRMEGDPILREGLKIRRRSTALLLANLLCLFPLFLINSPFISFPLIAFMGCSYIYSRKFRSWEKKNAEYLKNLGFNVRGV